MAEVAKATPTGASSTTSHSHLVFLMQVARPGLWSTTAMFYLMPLGHADFLHSAKLWLGLIFVLFPLSFLLYGVNDIVDAETDALNPRKGTFMFGARGPRAQLATSKHHLPLAQIPFPLPFYFFAVPPLFALNT